MAERGDLGDIPEQGPWEDEDDTGGAGEDEDADDTGDDD
jgi:hypothetical protein